MRMYARLAHVCAFLIGSRKAARVCGVGIGHRTIFIWESGRGFGVIRRTIRCTINLQQQKNNSHATAVA